MRDIAPPQSGGKPRGLFLNTSRANCSIYESGRMVYECLRLSERFEIDYAEITREQRKISGSFDFYAFNYHHVGMDWLDTRQVRRLPGLKTTFVLETLPNDPFVLCPSKDFDVYCAIDPTMQTTNPRVYAFPRPLEVPIATLPSVPDTGPPIIGTFGFATPGKGFELVVEAVNREFDEAIVRINIPPGTYAEDAMWKLQRRSYAEYLSELCRKVAKRGVQVVVTNDYLSKEELIAWCARNTLNCFLYCRNQPGLAATTDQAIVSGRPLAVSTNETFRHIHHYLKPYPFCSLHESIAASSSQVRQMREEWAPSHFARRFEAVLTDKGLFAAGQGTGHRRAMDIELCGKPADTVVRRGWRRFLRASRHFFAPASAPSIRPRASSSGAVCEATVLIVSHPRSQCGIHQYGLNIFSALRKSARYRFAYAECLNERALRDAVTRFRPAAILYNHYPVTMPWLHPGITRDYCFPQLGILHEVTQREADSATQELFDYLVCPDPTLISRHRFILKTPRLIPPYINMQPLPEIPTVGSFGFGFGDKGFEKLIRVVQEEFDLARIILRLPFNDIVDPGGKHHSLATAKRCRALVSKPGIELTIRHDFLQRPQLLDFLASNTLNAFFYDVNKDRGISSTIEHALAVQRPLAINRCGMFRHVHSATPSICIENISLRAIVANGVAPLVPFYHDWSEANFILAYERIFETVFAAKYGDRKATHILSETSATELAR